MGFKGLGRIRSEDKWRAPGKCKEESNYKHKIKLKKEKELKWGVNKHKRINLLYTLIKARLINSIQDHTLFSWINPSSGGTFTGSTITINNLPFGVHTIRSNGCHWGFKPIISLNKIINIFDFDDTQYKVNLWY